MNKEVLFVDLDRAHRIGQKRDLSSKTASSYCKTYVIQY